MVCLALKEKWMLGTAVDGALAVSGPRGRSCVSKMRYHLVHNNSSNSSVLKVRLGPSRAISRWELFLVSYISHFSNRSHPDREPFQLMPNNVCLTFDRHCRLGYIWSADSHLLQHCCW